MRYIFPLIIILLLISTSFTGVSGPSDGIKKSLLTPLHNGDTLYVGGSGPGNYSTIQEAIDNASDGDTVFVYNGTYVENVVVNKSISLSGEKKEITIIDSSGIDIWKVVHISADWVNISGFTIQKNETGEIDINADHTTISNNNIEKIQLLIRGTNNLISANKISGYSDENCYCGVELWHGHNTISDNIISGWELGIFQSESGSNVTISRNKISNNSWMGIRVFQTLSNSNIYGNIISDCETGLDISLSFNNLISGNTFLDNKIGIEISESSKNNISRNAFIGNDQGISLSWVSIFNKIYCNNFINNIVSARFFVLSFFNNWNGNYWGKSRILPKIIIGSIGFFIPSWINFDWHPAKEPYSI